MERVVLHAGHHREEEEGEYLGQVGGAGEEAGLLDEVRLAENTSHLAVVKLTQQQPWS